MTWMRWLCWFGLSFGSLGHAAFLPCPEELELQALSEDTAREWREVEDYVRDPANQRPLEHAVVLETLQAAVERLPQGTPLSKEAHRLLDLGLVPFEDFQEFCRSALGGSLLVVEEAPPWAARLELALLGLHFLEKNGPVDAEDRFFHRLFTQVERGQRRNTFLKLLYYASVKAAVPVMKYEPARIRGNLQMVLTPHFAAQWMHNPPEAQVFADRKATEDSLQLPVAELLKLLAD